MSKQNGYEVVGYEEVEIDRLSFHPSASIPIQDDARAYMFDQIAERGVIHQDILVLYETLEVIDGCNRVMAGTHMGLEKIRCKMIRTDNPRQIVLDAMSLGRSSTPGQRIMAYLALHADAAISAYRHNQDLQNGKTKDPLPDDLIPFTVVHIANRLKVSDKDVGNGIQVEIAARSDAPDIRSAAIKTRENLFAGGPIRKAISMLKGAAAPQQGQLSVKYSALLNNAFRSMGNSFEHRNKIEYERRATLSEQFYAIVEKLPEDLKVIARNALK